VKAWHWLAASMACEALAGAAMLAYFRAQAMKRTEASWGAVTATVKPEPAEGAKDGVSEHHG
jgi:hypothetical protein